MSPLRLFACGLLFTTLGTVLRAAEPAPADPHTGIAVDVTVTPLDAARTRFLCLIRVTELPSDQLISGINIQLVAGRSATAGSVLRSGSEVNVLAKVEEGGTAASYSVEYRKGAVVVATQKGSIAFSPAATGRN